MPLDSARDLFLSHASVNKPIVRKVAADICAERSTSGRSFTVWLDEAEIRPGQSIPGAVNAGLETSRLFALLLSPAYFESKSGWTDAEWHAILHADPDNRRGRVLPILIEDCPKLPPLLRHLRIIDMREARYDDGLRELIGILRDEPQQSAAIYKGQLILAGRRVSRQTLIAERSVIDAEPSPAAEFLSCNLLPVERLPTFVYSAPVAASLRTPRTDGTVALPPKAILRDIIRESQEHAGRKPFTPAFRMVGDEIVSFHDLETEDSPCAPIIDRAQAARDRTEEWLSDPDDRRIVTSLLNMAVSRHAYRHSLKEDGERHFRFFFPSKDGSPWSITWTPFQNRVPREVAGRRKGPAGEFWRHAAAYIMMTFLGNRFYLKIDPTWVFTTDGEHIMRGPEVGRLAVQWSGAERNLSLLYHIRFWSHVLRDKAGPISIRAGDQSIELSAKPAFVKMAFGIPGDLKDLDHGLDTWAETIEGKEERALEAALERQLSAAEPLTTSEIPEGNEAEPGDEDHE